MEVIKTELPGIVILEPEVWKDSRGFFLESYNENRFREIGIEKTFVQDNHSRSARGVLRGLHYQSRQPQAKLIRVTSGEVFDVAVDIRKGSPTFGKWTCVTLSAENKRMLFIPEGFAHGFYTSSEFAELQYKCSDFYCPGADHTILWNDEEMKIPWPLNGREPVVSQKDQEGKKLSEMPLEDLPVFGGEIR